MPAHLLIACLFLAIQAPVQVSHDGGPFKISPDQASNPTRQDHTLQFGLGYQPGPGPRLFAQYIYSGFPSGFTTVDLGWAQQLFGAFSYTHNVGLDPWVLYSITVTPSVFSDFEPNRLLNDEEVNERRTGGGINASLHYPLPERWSYNQHLLMQHSRIRLSPGEGPSSATNVTILETGPRLIRTTFRGLLPADLLLEGRLLGGWEHHPASLFGRTGIGGRWHNTLGSGFALNTEVHGEWVSPQAPVFERASFGGNFSVRGYRPDLVLGRILWSVQQEIWIPVPGTTRAVEGFAAWLRQTLRFAAFLDAGLIGHTDQPEKSGFRTGTGPGLRLRLGGVTLRIDWAHRLTDIAEGNFTGDFFVSIRPDATFFLFR